MIFRSALSVLSLMVFAASASAQQVQWGQFNGDLKAKKFSPLTQITPENVKNLRVAWRVRTGDKSDGTRPRPATAHQTEPARARRRPRSGRRRRLFVNDTVYLGTPFYRIFALEPDTGKVKWIYDPKARLEALTQPDLKNRGVAYWQADAIEGRRAVPEARLYRHHGREAAFGRCRYRQGLRRFRP